MKKVLVGAAAIVGALGATGAAAQSSVVVYGLIDTGVVYTTHANAAGNSVLKMPGLTGSFPSRIGFRGTEDLGDGLQAVFALETGFAPDTGAFGQGQRVFGRQAIVGLKNPYGTILLGRQLNMTYLVTLKSDVLGPNIFSIGNIDPYLPNARTDNAVGYLGTFSGVTVGATYSFGRDASAAGGPGATGCAGEVPGNAKACRQATAMLNYESERYGVSSSYDILYGNTGAANGLTSSDNGDRRVTLNGYFHVGTVKFGLGVIDRKTRAATFKTDSDLYYLGLTYPLSSALILDAQVGRLDTRSSPNDSTMTVARLSYNFSKRTAWTNSLGYMKNGGTAAIALDAGGTVGPGKNQTGFFTGIRHLF